MVLLGSIVQWAGRITGFNWVGITHFTLDFFMDLTRDKTLLPGSFYVPRLVIVVYVFLQCKVYHNPFEFRFIRINSYTDCLSDYSRLQSLLRLLFIYWVLFLCVGKYCASAYVSLHCLSFSFKYCCIMDSMYNSLHSV